MSKTNGKTKEMLVYGPDKPAFKSSVTEYISKKVTEVLKENIRSTLPYMEGIISQNRSLGEKAADLLPTAIEINEIPKFSNPISILLVEGLSMSFPVEDTMRYIQMHFDDSISGIKRGINSMTGELNNSIQVNIKAESNLIDKISRAMNLCGYYLAVPFDRIPMGRNVWLQYDPKYDAVLTDEIRKSERYLLHLTPEIYIPKIRKNGLIPRSKNQYATYPERVYLLRGSIPQSEIYSMYRMLSYVYNQKKENPSWIYGIVSVDVSRIPKDLKLFVDPNYPVYGLYTMDNIPPDAITNIKILDLKNI